MGMEYPSFAIAEHRNGVVLIETDEDDLTAFASFIPPYGGKPHLRKPPYRPLRPRVSKVVSQGRHSNRCRESQQRGKPIAIAQGRKPVKGKMPSSKGWSNLWFARAPKKMTMG